MSCIAHLFIKPRKGAPMAVVPALRLVANFGIEDDVNASVLSPRQVLVTRQEDLDDMAIMPGGLRENIVISGMATRNFLPGCELRIGDEARIRLTFHCEPCKRIAMVAPDLKAIIGRRGILGVVTMGGRITVGDRCEMIVGRYDAMPEKPYDRFVEFISRVPPGKVVTYKMAATAIGVADSFIRAMPHYIRRVLRDQADYPLHRLVTAHGALIESHIRNQRKLLADENTAITDTGEVPCVSLKDYLWHDATPF